MVLIMIFLVCLHLFCNLMYDIRYVHKRPALLQEGCKTNVNKPKIIKIPTKCDPDLSNMEELILQFYSFGMRILNFPLHELFSKKMCEIL